MRLLVVSQDFPPAIGGIQTYAAELARRFASRCEAVHVIAPAGPGAEAIDNDSPATVHRIACSSDLLCARAIPKIAALARRERLDTAFHAQWMTAAGSLLARPTGWPRRVFVAAHGRELLLRPVAKIAPMQRLYDRARTRALTSADGVIAVSHYTAGLAARLGVASGRLHVVPNGTDPERFVALPRDHARARAFRSRHGLNGRRVVLTLGRLVPHKGIDTAIAAIARLRERHPDVIYVIAGDGEDRDRLETLVRDGGVQDHVCFLGRVPDHEIVSCFAASDVFVTLSREASPAVEGFGVVFLEAAAAGRPSIGARTGGIPDAIASGETGLLVPPDDAVAAAQAIGRLLDDPVFAARLGAQGRRRVETGHTWAFAADRIHSILAA